MVPVFRTRLLFDTRTDNPERRLRTVVIVGVFDEGWVGER